jgi:hypothetical protein
MRILFTPKNGKKFLWEKIPEEKLDVAVGGLGNNWSKEN